MWHLPLPCRLQPASSPLRCWPASPSVSCPGDGVYGGHWPSPWWVRREVGGGGGGERVVEEEGRKERGRRKGLETRGGWGRKE